MSHYYNEWDKYAADWIRNLAVGGEIPLGRVDERSIEDVWAEDLKGVHQAHFFAGIGGWPLALRLAGWPESQPVWTGSCPCQPFSVAGKAGGVGDERHLWPAFRRLIAECRPPVIFGEQVASEAGRLWLCGVRADLEELGYAVGCADLPACSVGTPHVRQRLWWCASHADFKGLAKRDERGQHGAEEVASAWGGLKRVHAQGAWGTWQAESGVLPFVDGFPGRVGQVVAYGNAIVPELAAEFIGAFMDVHES